jgi:DNA-binding transcriptional LysR family regulator
MKISSMQLEAFYTVSKFKNFTKAAAAINVTQSALSQRILNLESDLETTLFIRDRSGIRLTEAATKLFQYCQFQEKFESDFLGQLKSKNSHELAGIISIAGYSSVLRSVILPSLNPLLMKHEQLQLKIQSMEMRDLLDVLKTGAADYIVTDHRIDRDEVSSIKIGVERYVLIESQKVRASQAYLDHDENDELTKKYLKHARKKTDSIKRHYLDDIYGLIDGVQNGLGRAVVPYHLVKALKGIRVIDPDIYIENPIYLCFFKQPFYSKVHESFVETVVKNTDKFLISD